MTRGGKLAAKKHTKIMKIQPTEIMKRLLKKPEITGAGAKIKRNHDMKPKKKIFNVQSCSSQPANQYSVMTMKICVTE